jgi:hypothetical protein
VALPELRDLVTVIVQLIFYFLAIGGRQSPGRGDFSLRLHA